MWLLPPFCVYSVGSFLLSNALGSLKVGMDSCTFCICVTFLCTVCIWIDKHQNGMKTKSVNEKQKPVCIQEKYASQNETAFYKV